MKKIVANTELEPIVYFQPISKRPSYSTQAGADSDSAYTFEQIKAAFSMNTPTVNISYRPSSPWMKWVGTM